MANAAKNMLTVDEVRAMAEELCEQGVTPSGNTLVEAAHAHNRPLSKRTALKHLEVLAAQGITFAPAAPVPLRTADDDPVYHSTAGLTTTLDPMEYHTVSPQDTQDPSAPAAPAPSTDPVALCEQAVKAADRHFLDARDALLQAKLSLLATRNLQVDSVLHGSLHQGDELHQEALADVDEHKRLYDAAWQRREQARQALESAIKRYQRQQQEQWVAVHHTKLMKDLDTWSEKLRTAPSDYAHAEAKKNYALLQFAYHQALDAAPTGSLLS